MRRRFLAYVARLTTAAPILVLAGCAVLTLIAAIAASGLFPIQTDILTLLPDSSPEAAVYQRSLQDFGSFDYLLVVVESDKPHQEDRLIRIAQRFAEPVRNIESGLFSTETLHIQRNEFVQSIEYVPGFGAPDPARGDSEERIAPGLLTEFQLARLEWLLRRELPDRLHLLRTKLVQHHSPAWRTRLLADPIGLRALFDPDQARFVGPVPGPRREDLRTTDGRKILAPSLVPGAREDGLLISEDGQMLLMVVRPRRPATDLLRTEQMMRWLRQVARYALESSGVEARGCRIGFIGSHAEAENDAAVIRHDLRLMMILSFALVIVLFLVIVRRLSALVLVSAPMGVGLVWTLGTASLFFDQISVVTCVFGVAMVGVGIDFSIHLYNRYLEERLSGRAITGSIETALCETGDAVLVGAITTAVAFFGICLTRFEGLEELGIVGGMGILCCLLASFLVLPPLILLSETLPGPLHPKGVPSGLGLGRLAATIRTYPRLTLTVGLIITAYLGFFAQGIRFDASVSPLREPPEHYYDLVRRTENRFELPGSQAVAIVSAPTLEDALRSNDHLYDRLVRTASREPQEFPILGFDSLRTVLPSIQTQRETYGRLDEILELQQLEEKIRAETRTQNFDLPITRTILEQIQEWKAIATGEEWVVFGDQTSPELAGTVLRNVYRDSTRTSIVTQIYLRQADWSNLQDDLAAFLKRGGNGRFEITGVPVVANALKKFLIRGIGWAFLLVCVVLYLLLLAHFRSVRKALVATLPVLCSVVWTLGAMHLLGMQLHFLNILVIPMILGLGIDDGIHIIQRYYEGGRRDIEGAVESTGRAVVFTSLMTMLAFGTLLFATFRGVREVGTVAVMGVGFALVAALFLVPALLTLGGERFSILDMVGRGGPEDEKPKTLW